MTILFDRACTSSMRVMLKSLFSVLYESADVAYSVDASTLHMWTLGEGQRSATVRSVTCSVS